MLRGRLIDVGGHRVRPPEDDRQVDMAAEVGQAREGRESLDRGSIRPHRDHVVPVVVQIGHDISTVSFRLRAGTDNRNRPAASQQRLHECLFTGHVFHADPILHKPNQRVCSTARGRT